jgi:CubicO group peptidase (beta-lactamase class C family)
MTSGIQFSERYDTISDAGKLYYTADIMQRIRTLKVQDPPGARFHYKSIDTQLLGVILTRATGKPLAQYLEEKLWHPLGMEFAASWSVDREQGWEKAFCCLNARARDFAKFGRLYLHKGTWNGQPIVPEAWVQRSTQVDTTQGSVWEYQYQW